MVNARQSFANIVPSQYVPLNLFFVDLTEIIHLPRLVKLCYIIYVCVCVWMANNFYDLRSI